MTVFKLPYPNSTPLFGEHPEGLANRTEVHYFVLELKESVHKQQAAARERFQQSTLIFSSFNITPIWMLVKAKAAKRKKKKSRPKRKHH